MAGDRQQASSRAGNGTEPREQLRGQGGRVVPQCGAAPRCTWSSPRAQLAQGFALGHMFSCSRIQGGGAGWAWSQETSKRTLIAVSLESRAWHPLRLVLGRAGAGLLGGPGTF